MTKIAKQKLKYLENEKRFKGETKNIFHHFKRAFSCQKLSQTLECAFKVWQTLKVSAKKISKTVGLLQKFQGILPRTSLIIIYKSFARPHLDYGDIIYYQTFNESFHQRTESIQYNAAIRGTSSEKFYQELGIEPLRSRRWLRKLFLFYKICKNKSPSYLYNLIPDRVKF